MRTKKLIGKTETLVIVLELDLDREHFAISGEEYDLPSFTEEEGETKAREYLENDTDLWKDAVANDRTTQSLEDWNEDALNTDGWESVLGDVAQIANGEYVIMSSCGQIDIPKDFTKIYITKSDLDFICECWKQYHLKPLTEIPDSVLSRIKRIFDKETSIEDYDESLKGFDPKDDHEKVVFD